MQRRLWTIVCLFTLASDTPVRADSPSRIDFAHQIVPIIKTRCGECHTNGKRKGSLSLDTREAILKAKVVVPGKSDESELLQRSTPQIRMSACRQKGPGSRPGKSN